MEHTNLIANELDRKCFKTQIVTVNGIEMIKVSLDTRKVHIEEIRWTLDQAFEGIEFNLSQDSKSVLVTE